MNLYKKFIYRGWQVRIKYCESIKNGEYAAYAGLLFVGESSDYDEIIRRVKKFIDNTKKHNK